MSDLRLDVNTVNEITPELAGFIQCTHDREFGDDPMIYAIPQWYIFGYLQGEPVTQVGILQRTITINQKPLLIAGISFPYYIGPNACVAGAYTSWVRFIYTVPTR